MSKKKTSNVSGIIITVIAALLAIASVVFLIITINQRTEDEPEGGTETQPTVGFVPDAELISEAEQSAYELLQNNYEIYRYLTKGMEVEEEPYGNLPEDGFYTCVTDGSEKLADFDKFSEYVHSVFVDEVAEKLLTDPFGNGPVYGYDQDGLGLSMNFVPSEEKGLSWADVHFTCVPLSEIECDLEVSLQDADGKEVIRKLKMVLEGGEWKLSEMIS